MQILSDGEVVLGLKCCASFLVSNESSKIILAFSACEIAELKRSIRLRQIGLQDMILNLEIVTLYMSPLLKIIFPPLHIKLSLMKQFVKALTTDGDCFKYIILQSPGLSIEKIKLSVFDA